jgi:hypothetical protein
VALVLATAIIGLGAWLAFTARPGRTPRARLVSRRDELLEELASMEKRARRGGSSVRDTARRPGLLAEIEAIYGELDDASPGPRGGGEDIAA